MNKNSEDKKKITVKLPARYETFLRKHKEHIDSAIAGTTDPALKKKFLEIWQRDSTNVTQLGIEASKQQSIIRKKYKTYDK